MIAVLGNYEEINRLVGHYKESEEQLCKLLGETRNTYEKRLKKIYSGIPSGIILSPFRSFIYSVSVTVIWPLLLCLF